jgi:hypothetical protein
VRDLAVRFGLGIPQVARYTDLSLRLVKNIYRKYRLPRNSCSTRTRTLLIYNMRMGHDLEELAAVYGLSVAYLERLAPPSTEAQ